MIPPIKNTEEALLYKAQLQAIDPSVEYLMTLYLSPELTPDEIRKASRAGIVGRMIAFSSVYAATLRCVLRGQIVSTRSDHQFRRWNRVLRSILSDF